MHPSKKKSFFRTLDTMVMGPQTASNDKFMEIMDGRTKRCARTNSRQSDMAYQAADWGEAAANNLTAESRIANKD
jgi:hypothetical protein